MTDRHAALFESQRRRLQAIAYRMLGSRQDAEDVVQEICLRFLASDLDNIETPHAWLVAAVTRACIDRLRRLKLERNTYPGPWLPEPWVEPLATLSAQDEAERASDLSMAFFLLLERLAPEERAAFLLRQVLDWDYADIAQLIGKSPAATRQIVHRAIPRVTQADARFRVSREDAQELLNDFLEAIRTSDMTALVRLLKPDSRFIGDGGGKVKAALKPIEGAAQIARFLIGVTAPVAPLITGRLIDVNGSPGLALYLDRRLVSILTADIDEGGFSSLYNVANPDKLMLAARELGASSSPGF